MSRSDSDYDCISDEEYNNSLSLKFIANFTIAIFSPVIAIAAVRHKNIKERKAGVDPLQFNYKKM